MCQVHTATSVALLAPEKTDYTTCHPENINTYILHVVPITTYTHVRRKSIGKKKRKEKAEKKEKGYSDEPNNKRMKSGFSAIFFGIA